MTDHDELAGLTLIGCGRMGLALLKGWIARTATSQNIQVMDPNPSPELLQLARSTAVSLTSTTEAAPGGIVVLAVKPQSFHEMAWARGCLEPGGLLLSVMAGIRLVQLRAVFPQAASVIRAMPNLAASEGQSATVLVADEDCTARDRSVSERLLGAIGTFEWLDSEEMVDAATAVSGSGPAYVFYLVECLAKAGVRVGLPPATSARLARATLQGAGAVLANRSAGPDMLRKEVTSPDGATEAALVELMRDDRFSSAILHAVLAGTRRSRELSHAKAKSLQGKDG